MAKQQQRSAKPRKASVDYNLEKPPLQTGVEVSAIGLREKVAGDTGEWGSRRRSAGILAALFFVIIVGIGITAASYLDDLLELWWSR